jgi:hypothetical protein
MTGGIRNFNLRNSQVRKREKSGLNQSLICRRHFSPLSPKFFIRILFLSRKIIGGGHLPPLLPPQSNAYVNKNFCCNLHGNKSL